MNLGSRRVLAMMAVVTAIALVQAPSVGSAEPTEQDAFVGAATGRALNIEVFGEEPAVLGHSRIRAISTPLALAEGAGRLLDDSSTAVAEVTQPGASERDPATGTKCATDAIPVPTELVLISAEVGLACGVAEASLPGALPQVRAEGSVASLDLHANELFGTLIGPIQGPLEDLFGSLPDALDPATDTVSDLLTELGSAQTLRVRLGGSISDGTSALGKVNVSAFSAAGTIDILPDSTVYGPYFARIEISSAKASAAHDRDTGAGAASFDPAIVRVLFSETLGLPPIEVPGTTVTIGEDTPLETTIRAADGETFQRPDGSVAAVADGVMIHALKGIEGGILFELAHAEAAVAGTPLQVTKVANPTNARVGQNFTTTISIHNPHECPVVDVSVTDTISVLRDARFEVVSSDPSANSVPSGANLSSGVVKWNNIGTIGPGETKSVAVTLEAQNGEGRIDDVAVAAGTFGKCPASDDAAADVIAAAVTDVPVVTLARLEVPTVHVLPRTGPGTTATLLPGLAILALAGIGLQLGRRRR